MKSKFLKVKNGFTLVELLAVIALLGVVFTIASLSISSIKHKVQETQKANVISNIKVAAKKYVNDTGIKKVYVETLISNGFIEADNEAKEIVDPVEKESMNCYIVDFMDESNPTVTKTEAVNGKCNEELIADAIINIKYCETVGCNPITDGKDISELGNGWSSKNITLGADISNLKNMPSFDESLGVSYTWIIPLDPSSTQGTSQTLTVNTPTTGYIDATYQVKVLYNSKEYSASTKVKIDTHEPSINSLFVEKQDEWANEKTLSVRMLDNGSGIAAYAITTSNTPPEEGSSEWTDVNSKDLTINKKITSIGTYFIWIKDNAGNINNVDYENSKNKIQIIKVDSVAPQCIESQFSDEWKNGPITVWWGCKDSGGSGCKEPLNSVSSSLSLPAGVILYANPVTISNTTLKYSLPQYTIYDNAGNSTICNAKQIPVYVDESGPIIGSFTITSNSNAYHSTQTTIKVNASDAQSGMTGGKICITTYNNPTTCTWEQYKGNPATISYTFDFSGHQTGREYVLYAFAQDSLGNISSSKSSSYRLYRYCAEETSSDGTLTSICSESCGGGYYKRNVVYYDAYFTSHECRTGYRLDYTKPCNTQACCDEGEWEYDSCSNQGFVIESRYNGCKGEWETRTTTDTCSYGGTCSIPGACVNEKQETTCTSTVGGQEVTTVYESSCSNKVYLNDYYYLDDCNRVYVTYCEGPLKNNPKCKVTSINGVSTNVNVKYNELKDDIPSYCLEDKNDLISVTPNGSITPNGTPDVNICSYGGDVLFGKYKGHYAGNSGSAVSANKSWGDDWCHANGTTCYAKVGYERICVAEECGEYKGRTSKSLKKELGCTWASYWCSCK
ncbi:MAG: type II secretion system protein [Bacilli bacterium]|nr:type II secretion system protein [Bacilli bacterium]